MQIDELRHGGKTSRGVGRDPTRQEQLRRRTGTGGRNRTVGQRSFRHEHGRCEQPQTQTARQRREQLPVRERQNREYTHGVTIVIADQRVPGNRRAPAVDPVAIKPFRLERNMRIEQPSFAITRRAVIDPGQRIDRPTVENIHEPADFG
jgi:hypothetical protein